MFETKEQEVEYNPAILRSPTRLAALKRLDLLDSPPEEAFDRITRLLAKVNKVPIALVSLLDADRQFFKSQVGLSEPWSTQRETPLSHSLCQYVVMSGRPLLVEDAREHVMLRDSLAISDLHMIAYAGVPLTTSKGDVLGTLSMIDSMLRAWTQDEIDILHDLAAALMVEFELRNKSIELAEQNTDLEAFAQTVAHDLKSPISTVLGYTELLQLDLAAIPQVYLHNFEQSVGYIHASANKMVSIINALLKLARVRQPDVEAEPIDMAKVVTSVQARLITDLEHAGAVLNLPSSWPIALGNALWIEEVWTNYITNALKYGGRPPRVTLGAEQLPDGMLRFWVQDNGHGLTAEQQSRLFQPFVRLHTDTVNVEGHGLGLSIVQRIMEKLNGRVEVRSELEHGSIFSFILPAATP